jgi:microcystin-dependent protein
MAKILSQTEIDTSQTVEAWHVTQSIDAFTGVEAYNITLSGSFTLQNGTQGTNKIAISNAEGNISFTNNITASLHGTASYALSSSYAVSSSRAISSSYALSSSYAVSSSYALSSSYAVTSSYVASSSYALSSSYAVTSSYVASSSYALSSSYAVTASYIFPEIGIPVGTVVPWAGKPTAPTPDGWLLCDGSAIVQLSYPELFDVIGFTYGNVQSGYFRVPNLENRIPVGQGKDAGSYNLDTIGATGGDATITLTKQNIPKHTHNSGSLQPLANGSTNLQANWDSAYNGLGGENGINTNTSGNPDWEGQVQGGMRWPLTITGSTEDGTLDGLNGDAHGNMQPYIVMRYIIKY